MLLLRRYLYLWIYELTYIIKIDFKVSITVLDIIISSSIIYNSNNRPNNDRNTKVNINKYSKIILTYVIIYLALFFIYKYYFLIIFTYVFNIASIWKFSKLKSLWLEWYIICL